MVTGSKPANRSGLPNAAAWPAATLCARHAWQSCQTGHRARHLKERSLTMAKRFKSEFAESPRGRIRRDTRAAVRAAKRIFLAL